MSLRRAIEPLQKVDLKGKQVTNPTPNQPAKTEQVRGLKTEEDRQ